MVELADRPGVSWVVIVPVKRLAAAKTRLRAARPDLDHERLVLAMAQDTVAAALAGGTVHAVVVATDDPTAAAALARLGARIVADRPGLNAAITHAAAESAAPGLGQAALPADLPALRPDELDRALAVAATVAGPGYVADHTGTGTVLLTAPPGVPLRPSFGPNSAAAHARAGALPLPGDWPGLRRDVDTPADLAAATALGLGRYTAAVPVP